MMRTRKTRQTNSSNDLRSLGQITPWLVLLIAPLLASWPALVGFSADPIFLNSGLLIAGRPGLLSGMPNLDLNVGVTTEALGHLAAQQWLHGQVPWWNAFSGIGMPLAGVVQASALFLPFVLLLDFQNGPFLLKLVMQSMAGLSTYALLRQLGMGRSTSLLGGLLFAFDGSFAWIGHGPIMPLPFLPLFLLGIERARTAGYRLVALAVAFSIYAGFPETAYLDGLMALVWFAWRFAGQTLRWRFAGRVALGGILGLALAAPQLWSFAHVLLHSTVENHALALSSIFDPLPTPPMPGAVESVWLLPYVFGQLQSYTEPSGVLSVTLAYMGGYVGAVPICVGLVGLWGRRERPMRWMLLLWVLVCLAGVASIPGIGHLFYAVPLLRQTIVARYVISTWHLAAIILAAFAIDDWRRGALVKIARPAAALGMAALMALCLYQGWDLMRILDAAFPRYWIWPASTVLWATVTVGAALWVFSGQPTTRRLAILSAVMVLDASAMFTLPMLSGPRDAAIDMAAVDFLKHNTGLQRFYTLGPYGPNYGAFFQTAQVNHEYLPIPENWATYVGAALDPSAHRIFFRGNTPALPPDVPSHAEQMVRHLAGFRDLATRYVVTPAGQNPFAQSFETATTAPQGASVVALPPGGEMAGQVVGKWLPGGVIDEIGVLIGTYLGAANGRLVAELCHASECSTGEIDLTQAADNAVAAIPLVPPLETQPGEALRWRLRHIGGTQAVAVSQSSAAVPRLAFTLRPTQTLAHRVYRDRLMDIYELDNAAPYFEALGGPCQVQAQGRADVAVRCDAPARLVRRELFFSGWRASVDGAGVPIVPYGEVMQQIDLPAGATKIHFEYAPPYINLAWGLLVVGVIGLLGGWRPWVVPASLATARPEPT